MNLHDADLAMFLKSRVPIELLERARIQRVSDQEARDQYGIKGTGALDGIAFPYWRWDSMLNGSTWLRCYVRIRRDFPDIEDGKVARKYLAPYSDRRHLYLPPVPDYFQDLDIPIIIVESEKAALALTAWSTRTGKPFVPVATGGCWGWRGRIGKIDGPNGERLDEKGSLPELREFCRSERTVYVMLDANADTNLKVRSARSALCKELLNFGARVLVASVPNIAGVNGPDDLIAAMGDGAITSIIDLAVPASQVAIADAEAIIAGIKQSHPNHDPDELRHAIDVIGSITDELMRQALQSKLADAVRGVIPKKVVVDEVRGRREQQEQRQAAFGRETRHAELRRERVDPAELINDLEQFFLERALLPPGAALACAYFALNTWTFDVFDTTPYICLESATPRCGKSTVIHLLAAVSARSETITAMNEAIFRLIHQVRPTLCIDEAELLEGRSDRSESLRAILNEGYKVGGKVPRCVGEDHNIEFFDVYCPKIFAAIGGLSGALVDRCLIIHMQRCPRESKLKSTRVRALSRDAKPLLAKLQAYEVQYREALRELYDREPDEGYWPGLVQREAELWTPQLIASRLAGPASEAKLIKVVTDFGRAKDEIEAQDSHVARTIALYEALNRLTADVFSPADLVEALSESDAWASSFARAKGSDEKNRERLKATAVGVALRRFRLQPLKRTKQGQIYDVENAKVIIRAHTPGFVTQVTPLTSAEVASPEPIDNKGPVQPVQPVQPFADVSPEDTTGLEEGYTSDPDDDGMEDVL